MLHRHDTSFVVQILVKSSADSRFRLNLFLMFNIHLINHSVFQREEKLRGWNFYEKIKIKISSKIFFPANFVREMSLQGSVVPLSISLHRRSFDEVLLMKTTSMSDLQTPRTRCSVFWMLNASRMMDWRHRFRRFSVWLRKLPKVWGATIYF